ncbi:hypothetical protein IVB22_34770 [Bradyrhizobium sp. 190]|uniref:hypothetical protein n=1 Tax=Bradyrhizobium sp. 190 TaxID=2782658 RepID=UPI001FF72D72|nr:hypothetical protein [Bradyrhizobium sp. 190]MCK1517558.1 hypothetical protein [Bradyrhizobium sp. 190]
MGILKVGGEYKLDQIGSRQWQKFARETRVDADEVIARLDLDGRLDSDPLTDPRAKGRISNAVIERLAATLRVLDRWAKKFQLFGPQMSLPSLPT